MVETIIISDWKEISDLEIEFPSEVFRGQADASWLLSTSIQRSLQGTDWEEDIANTEFWLLREFKKKAGLYLQTLPTEDDIIGWLSLMQQHGTPTRLLDFSHSFYIACYFAVCDAKSDSAIWAIDPQWLLQIGRTVLNIEQIGLRDEWEDSVYLKTNEMLTTLLSTAATASEVKLPLGAVCVEPFFCHQRIGMQQGLFVVPYDIQKTFLGNLEPFMPDNRMPIRKFILKFDIRETALAHLREMNITAETLFPGIDGFAKSLIHKYLCM